MVLRAKRTAGQLALSAIGLVVGCFFIVPWIRQGFRFSGDLKLPLLVLLAVLILVSLLAYGARMLIQRESLRQKHLYDQSIRQSARSRSLGREHIPPQLEESPPLAPLLAEAAVESDDDTISLLR